MANQDLYNQILSGWNTSGVGSDWNGSWSSPGEFNFEYNTPAPVRPTSPTIPDDFFTNIGAYPNLATELQNYGSSLLGYNQALKGWEASKNKAYTTAQNEYNNNLANYDTYNQSFNSIDWNNMPWDEYTNMGLDTDQVRRLYASGIQAGMSAADIDAAIRTNALQFAPTTNMDIPTPNEGTGNLDYSESNSSTYSGLTPELQAQLSGWLNKMDPWVADYGKVLKGLRSPGAFTEAYKPVQDNLIKGKLNELVNKGLMSSSDADTMFKEVLSQAPTAYLQNMGTAADAYGTGMSKLLEGMNMGKYTEGSSSSYSQTPSTNWQMMIDALG